MDILGFYRNIPSHIDPTAFTVGFLAVRWYSLLYLAALVAVYLLLAYRIKRDPDGGKFQGKLSDFLSFAMAGAIIGGRLGYVFFYNPAYYLQNPLAVISPYDSVTGGFIGIYGMSYHGGMIGIVLATLIFVKKKKIDFWQWADFVVPAIPAGYFFGRIGNFLNLELYGRVTDSRWGMYFPSATGAGPFLRYPSQLFEAFTEGLLLFAILWLLRNKNYFPGSNLVLYLMGYGIIRLAVEFFREPDKQIGFILDCFTLGQFFSLVMVLVGVAIYFYKRKKLI
ncbi:MAG: prolipoprotein diacylglyceryl transferase [Candidatus Moranbacteria bacterium]|nr:prolipoprotein diacylglyceryl transferase [Candidatus Moranbacteria bacterium]